MLQRWSLSNNVIRYTPDAVKDNEVFDKHYQLQKSEIDNLHGIIGNVVDNAYIDTADASRLSEWEEVLLLPDGSSRPPTLRKKDIKDYLAFLPPITRYTLEDMLDSKYGQGNYFLRIRKELYEVIIGVDSAPDDYFEYMYGWLRLNGKTYTWLSEQTYSQLGRFRGQQESTNTLLAEQSFRRLLRKLIPANMLLTIGIKYMYGYIRGLYTYSELEQYTYKYLSQYSDYECPDKDAKPKLVNGDSLNLSTQYWDWHTVPYVEDEALYVDGQDVSVGNNKLTFIVELKEEYR